MSSKEKFGENLRPSFSECLAVGDMLLKGGLIHLRESQRLSKKGIAWYPLGSFCLPIMTKLTGRSPSTEMLPFVTYLSEYVGQVDRLIDERTVFPTWGEYKDAGRQSQSKILNAIAESGLNQKEKRMLAHKIAELRKKAFAGFQEKESWENDPSFEMAYDYRLKTSGTMWEAVAEAWCAATNVPQEKREDVREATIRFGMVAQYLDDLMDIRDDGSMDGNLIRAIINENPREKEAMEKALQNIKGKPKIMILLTQHARQSRDTFLEKLNDEISPIRDTSSSVENLLRAVVKIFLPRIVISNGYFYNRLHF